MTTVASRAKKARKVKAARTKPHECFAELPDGAVARRVTSLRYTHALCLPQVGRSGLWMVYRWSKDQKRLEQEARRRNAQGHGERAAVVVRVEILKR